jgi:BirA family biotin operon repressor/biotin-[acetyl-CoA-carboxylase] ligase
MLKNPLNESRVREMLTTRIIGRELIYRASTGSTSNLAKELAGRGAAEGLVVVADEQTAGRGRMDRRWLAPAGTCILCSILFRPDLAPQNANRLTMLCALAAADALAKVAGLRAALKWPNDLVVGEESWRKLAGVLTDTGILGEKLSFAVVGIGINVNVHVDALADLAPNATSVMAETGQFTDRETLLAALLAGIENRYTPLRSGENPLTEWATRLATLGRRVTATTAQGALTGIAEAVDEDGALLLRTDEGRLVPLAAGDVTLHA